MKVYSLRFRKNIRQPILLLLLLVAVIAVGRFAFGLIPQGEQPASASIKNQAGKSEKDRQSFITSFGWVVEEEPCEVAEVVIPKEFDEVYTRYNEIQKQQGLDLSKYQGKKCKRYTYVVTNYPGDVKSVRINVLVASGKIIGGDVCSLGLDGFMHGFALPEGTTQTATGTGELPGATAADPTATVAPPAA